MNLLKEKLKWFNITVTLRGPRMIKFIKSLVWNLWQIEDGLENFFFTK